MKENEIYIPFWKKSNLTIDEAVAYTGLGMHKLADIVEYDSSIAFWTGKKRLFKRKRLEEYLDNMFSI